MLKDATETLNNVKDSVHGAFQDHTESQRKLDLTLQEILKVFQGNEKLIIKQGEVLRKSEDLIVRVGENQKALTDSMRRWRRAGFDVRVVYPWPARRFDKSDFADSLVEDGPDPVRDRIATERGYGNRDYQPPSATIEPPVGDIPPPESTDPPPSCDAPIRSNGDIFQPGETNLPA